MGYRWWDRAEYFSSLYRLLLQWEFVIWWVLLCMKHQSLVCCYPQLMYSKLLVAIGLCYIMVIRISHIHLK